MYFAPQDLTCKICERGSLVSRKVFRLSGPAVAIGYILLIPSVLGMIFCALMLAGVFAVSSQPEQVSNLADRPAQSAFDATFRQNCMDECKRLSSNAELTAIEGYCECALSTYKVTNSIESSRQSCIAQSNEGRLAPVSPDVAALYSVEDSQPSPSTETTDLRTPDPLASYKPAIFRVLGGGVSVALGIGFLISGLLGWLLVMKKRVLKCNYCGAVVSAS
jgi:hypothetical protein